MGRRAQISITGRRTDRLGNAYLAMLAFVLVGYALFGRGFAYIGYPPVFVGEITLLIGIAAMIASNRMTRVLTMWQTTPLLLFMIWGAARTIPYLSLYGVDAVRDAAIWGYGLFALTTAAVLIAVPERLLAIIKFYRRFAPLFLIALPFVWLGARFLDSYEMPLTHGPLIDYKPGDMCVHLGGCFAFIVAMGQSMNPWIAPIMVPINLGLNLQGRAAVMSFVASAGIVSVLRPFNQKAMQIFAVIAMGLALLWATDFKIKDVNEREISFDFLVQGVKSIVQDDANDPTLRGTKEWRLRWWTDIIDYTIKGKYFWDGKGYGINLADDDGYQLDGQLRSPHNGHLTILARSGVPGAALWIITQLGWLYAIVRTYLRAERRKQRQWSGFFLFLAAYWAAFMTNASFDVFIEGPMGGIWLWTIFGVGIAAMQIYRRYPLLLEPAPMIAVEPYRPRQSQPPRQLRPVPVR